MATILFYASNLLIEATHFPWVLSNGGVCGLPGALGVGGADISNVKATAPGARLSRGGGIASPYL